MSQPIGVRLFFNFRSPYCYLASKTLWTMFDNYPTSLHWYPVGGWDLRSSPDVARSKMPLARQDIARFARRLKIPYNPPPPETDPTLAGAGSLYAEHAGLLRPYIQAVMHAEWGEGKNIGDSDVLLAIAEQVGLDKQGFADAIHREDNHRQLQRHAEIAKEHGVIGVPTFMIGEQIFWGQDRIDFVLEELERLTQQGDD